MLAVDTNIIVRFLTRDDEEQFARAAVLIRDEEVYLCATVLLETEWVLRSVYRFAPSRIEKALRAFLGLPRVTVEDPATIALAMEWTTAGIDFADALHLARTRHCEAFVSFDRQLAAASRQAAGVMVRAP
ncbi:MAG: type II toxin-antitoxin system VapC family toxin [Alphaproteobacteria bacterium]|nr:type II toxin-antitoxin system VapC family toxin [Alphaproteobacteria bacterium]